MTVFSTLRNSELTYGIVYKIIDRVTTDILYIGSTFNYPARKINHKSDCNNVKSIVYNSPIYKHIRTLENGFNNIKFKIIVFIETNDKTELVKLERKYIDSLTPLCNVKKEGRTRKQHYIDNKVILLKQMHQYRNDNKDKIKQYRIDNKEQSKQYRIDNKEKMQEKYICIICRGKYTIANKAKHNKSIKHQQAINSNILLTTEPLPQNSTGSSESE